MKIFAPVQSSSTQLVLLCSPAFCLSSSFFFYFLVYLLLFPHVQQTQKNPDLAPRSSDLTFSTSPFYRAVGISSAGGPTGPSKGWASFPCLPPHRSGRGNRHLCPGAGTSSLAWFWDTCRPHPWHEPTAVGLHGECGAHPVCRLKWCWRWTSTTLLLCPLSEHVPGQLGGKNEVFSVWMPYFCLLNILSNGQLLHLHWFSFDYSGGFWLYFYSNLLKVVMQDCVAGIRFFFFFYMHVNALLR